MKINSNLIPNSQYSVNETQIGIWYDGKPLYRKVITSDNNTTAMSISHGISNLKQIINIYGGLMKNNYNYPLNNSSPYSATIYDVSQQTINVRLNQAFSTWLLVIVAEYTKTTD